VKRRLFLYVVIRQGPAVLELLPGEDQALLVRRDALIGLDLGRDVVEVFLSLHGERGGLARQRLHDDLLAATDTQHQVERRLLQDVVVP
jgi:hypothetical protein